MKILFLTLSLTLLSFVAFAQADVSIQNNSSCDLRIDMVEYDNSCSIINTFIVTVPAGSNRIASASTFQLVDANIYDNISGCYITSISAVNNPPCVQCNGVNPSNVTTAGCGGPCAGFTAIWQPGCPLGPNYGVIEIF